MQYRLKEEIDPSELEDFGFEREYDDEDEEEFYGRDLDNGDRLLIYDNGEVMQVRPRDFGYEPVDLDDENVKGLINAGVVEEMEDDE